LHGEKICAKGKRPETQRRRSWTPSGGAADFNTKKVCTLRARWHSKKKESLNEGKRLRDLVLSEASALLCHDSGRVSFVIRY